MNRRTLVIALVLSFTILAGLTHLHVSGLATGANPDRVHVPADSHEVELAGIAPSAIGRPDVIVPPQNETTLTAPEPPRTPVYDEVREVELDEAYDRLHSVAFDTRLAQRHVRDLELIVRDVALHEDLRRLAVWGLARGGDLESVRSQLVDGNAPGVQLTALEMLRRHEGQAAFDLIAVRAREARDPRVRESALRSLGHLDGTRDFEAFLRDGDASVRSAALELLSHGHHEEAVRTLLEHVPEQESETIALARALSAHAHSPGVIERIDELARRPALSPDAARSIALSRRYAEHPELTAVACSGSH